MGLKSSVADPDVWIKPTIKSDGEEDYKFILVYVEYLIK